MTTVVPFLAACRSLLGRKMRWLAFPLFLVAFPAFAAPALTGPLIYTVNSDRQSYRAGEVANLTVQLQNTTGLTFTGTLTGKMYGRGLPISSPAVALVGPLLNGSSATVILRFPTQPGVNYQGYFVYIVAARTGAPVPTDTAAAAIDQSSGWSTYPRTCWAAETWTRFGSYTPSPRFAAPEVLASGLNAWHCNVLMFYDQLYRRHVPYVDKAQWLNGDLLLQQRDLIVRYISAAHRLRIGALAYFPMYAADMAVGTGGPNFENDRSGASIKWGVFTSNCSPSCTLSQMKGYPSNPAATAQLAIMNPFSSSWRDYWIAQARRLLANYRYDGIFIDTFGRWQVEHDYTYDGATVNFNGAYNTGYMSRFVNNALTKLHAPVVSNGVDNAQEYDLARSGETFYWSEGYSMRTYPSIVHETEKIIKAAKRTPLDIGVNWAWYINQAHSNLPSCQPNPSVCFFNLPGMLYYEATAFAAGAYHSWILDGDRFDSEGYPVANQLSTTPAIVEAEYDYQTFGVAYEKLLRNNIRASSAAAPSITSGAMGDTGGAAGHVYLLAKMRSGFNILHMLNYQQLSSNDNQDTKGNYPAPKTIGPLSIKMYYTHGTLGNLWLASPDRNHGLAQQLSYKVGSDGFGSFITFIVPSLTYWNMLWLEDNVMSSDYRNP